MSRTLAMISENDAAFSEQHRSVRAAYHTLALVASALQRSKQRYGLYYAKRSDVMVLGVKTLLCVVHPLIW
jgi:hypothetical protein